MRIIGIDPSLTATGIALIDTNYPDHIHTETIRSAKTGNTIPHRLTRFGTVADTLLDTIPTHPAPDHAIIEGPAYAAHGAGTWDRAGMWWNIARILHRLDIPTIEVPPATRCQYATGRGNADKDVVMISTVRRYPTADITNNNEADALILAAIGARLHGHPIDDIPKANLRSLAKLTATHDLEQVTT